MHGREFGGSIFDSRSANHIAVQDDVQLVDDDDADDEDRLMAAYKAVLDENPRPDVCLRARSEPDSFRRLSDEALAKLRWSKTLSKMAPRVLV
jgi:hypothetical protein